MHPRITVSVVIPCKDKYLYVCNEKGGRWSFPSGKRENGESLEDALKRETREETNTEIDIQFLIGIYQFRSDNGHDVINFVYYATIEENPHPGAGAGILKSRYFSLPEAEELVRKGEMRAGNANLQPIKDYEQGQRFPKEIVHKIINPL